MISIISTEVLLEICTHLPSCSLAKLSRTSRNLNPAANHVLYKRDAQREYPKGSKALKHAVTIGCTKPDRQEEAIAVYNRALSFGADVNGEIDDDNNRYMSAYGRALQRAMGRVISSIPTYVTALGVAVGHGDFTWTRKLLQSGASVSKPSCSILGLLRFPGVPDTNPGSVFPGFQQPSQISMSADKWFPLYLAMLRASRELVALLIAYGAPPALVRPLDLVIDVDGHVCALTVHHFCAAKDTLGLSQSFIRRFPSTINTRTTTEGLTPLRVALATENMPVFEALLEAKADVHRTSAVSYSTCLDYAIERSGLLTSMGKGPLCRRQIAKLLEAGAHVNTPNSLEDYTPLMQVMASAEWDLVYRDMKPIADLLLERGADVNFVNNRGETAVAILVKRIAETGDEGSQSLEKFLEELVRKHNADLNLSNVNGRSILGYLLGRRHDHPPGSRPAARRGSARLMKKVIGLGATVHDHEVRANFVDWVTDRQFRGIYDLAGQHKAQITQEESYKAFLMAMVKHDYHSLEFLLDYFDHPIKAPQLVWKALTEGVPKEMTDLLLRRLKFDANWTNAKHAAQGGGFLHCVARLSKEGRFDLRRARVLSEELVRRGASLLAEDPMGETAVDLFEEFWGGSQSQAAKRLLKFLQREKQRELDRARHKG